MKKYILLTASVVSLSACASQQAVDDRMLLIQTQSMAQRAKEDAAAAAQQAAMAREIATRAAQQAADAGEDAETAAAAAQAAAERADRIFRHGEDK